jgi:formylglycine-generating enzyme required for sulfatase activity
MTSVFLSYRREDSRHQIGRLYDGLVAHFGLEQVFKDVDSIPLGWDFREVLTERVAGCEAFLAVIGDSWLSVVGKSGMRRLDDPADSVRIEIEAALSRKILVIPVLVGNCSIPQAEELPESLRGLSFRNGLSVRPDPDFHNDMDRLIHGIKDGVSALRARGPETQRPEARKTANKTSLDPRDVHPKRPEKQTPPPISPMRLDKGGSSTVGAGAARPPNGRPWRVGLAALAVVVAVVASVIVIPQLGPPTDRTKQGEMTQPPQSVVKPEDLPKGQRSVPSDPPKLITNTIGMKLALIPAGEFLMGSPDDDKDAAANEKPQRRMGVKRPFYLGVTEVTQGQYKAVTGENPSHFRGSDDLPVETVSWNNVIAFCDKLSEREGLKPYYRFGVTQQSGGDGYRLPTEAEWEYACRGGNTTRYSFGDDAASLGDFAWFSGNSGPDPKTHPVGQKRPNGFDLYDMQGNVWEWCEDVFDGSDRVVRGGSWLFPADWCRAACRGGYAPADTGNSLGFRLARVPSGQ